MNKTKKSINKYLIYTGNHRSHFGISEYLEYFKRIESYKLKFEISEKLDLTKNYKGIIVIEEFTDYRKFRELSFFLNKFKGKKILLLTEFIKNNSFNNFSNNQSRILKFFFENYKFFHSLIYYSRIINNISKNILNLFSNNFKNKILDYDLKLTDYSYFLLRYIQYLKIYDKFDFFFISHEKIKLKNIKKNRIFVLDYFLKLIKKIQTELYKKESFFFWSIK